MRDKTKHRSKPHRRPRVDDRGVRNTVKGGEKRKRSVPSHFGVMDARNPASPLDPAKKVCVIKSVPSVSATSRGIPPPAIAPNAPRSDIEVLPINRSPLASLAPAHSCVMASTELPVSLAPSVIPLPFPGFG